MSTRKLSFLLVLLWVAATLYLPIYALRGSASKPVLDGNLLVSFEGKDELWASEFSRISSLDSRLGKSCLQISWKNDRDGEVFAPDNLDLSESDSVIFEMKLSEYSPRNAAAIIKPLLFFKNKDGQWFQCSGKPLVSGEWTSYRFDISQTSLQLSSVHISSPWDGTSKRYCTHWGFNFSSSNLERAEILLDNIRVIPTTTAEASVFALSLGKRTLEVYELYESSFEITPEPDNPFDPDSADIWATFESESGKIVKTPAFYYKPYNRKISGGVEAINPNGKAEWRVRFTPTEAGEYSWHISGQVDGKQLSAGAFRFTATKSSEQGFVRIEKRSRYFSMDNGDFFYPIGHNFRSPTDTRTARLLKEATPADIGTFKYDEVLRKMSSNGENSFELWMASWFTEIEWTREWKNYRGLGVYNLANAWKIDYILNLARSLDLKVHLVFENHGQISNYCDDEWNNSPYNVVNVGGMLKLPTEFWKNREAKSLYRKKLRYIVARWGYSPTIMGFELVSELDLTGTSVNSYKHPNVLRWHREMSNFIRDLDPNKHLITTHFSQTFKKIYIPLATSRCLDYVVCDAYRGSGDIASLMNLSDRSISSYARTKPYFITEFGGTPHGNSLVALEADLHCGLWSSYMTNAAGAPYFWWFDLIERENWYHHFGAFAKFHRGERRGLELLKTLRVRCSSNRMFAMSIGSSKKGYAWVCSKKLLSTMKEKSLSLITEASISIEGVKQGSYEYEIWNTSTGKIEVRDSIKAEKIRRRTRYRIKIPLPDFKTDYAIKFRKKG